MKQVNTIQIIDALVVGGAERLAVSYANGLKELGVNSHLCVTRAEGKLNEHLSQDVGYIFIKRKRRFDFPALFRLRSYVKKHGISIVHAHATSYFIGIMLKITMPSLRLIFHDHYGNSEFLQTRHDAFILKKLAFMFDYYIGVNMLLVTWANDYLQLPKSQVLYFANYPRFDNISMKETVLEGINGKRILCLANYRPQKDHPNLINAFNLISTKYPEWTLHLVGLDNGDEYCREFKKLIIELKLENRIFVYGGCNDIYNVLQQSDVGVLSSESEGLPIALLEYGLASLAVVCTSVGECTKVLDNGKHGLLVEPNTSAKLASALESYLQNPALLQENARSYHEHISKNYSEDAILKELLQLYNEKS